MQAPMKITSRSNPLIQRLRKLAREPGAYRLAGEVWIEGDHLVTALHQRGFRAKQYVMADSAWASPRLKALADACDQVVRVPDQLFDSISGLVSPARIGCILCIPAAAEVLPGVTSLILDRLQDAGNVGSILRSAAAFGVNQILALQGTTALWSAKVLRAGMGAHFSLRLVEGLRSADLVTLQVPWVGTSSHALTAIDMARLPNPCAWVFGHEGQGVAAEMLSQCSLVVGIRQPGGGESVNVAAAAAICLHESARQRVQGS